MKNLLLTIIFFILLSMGRLFAATTSFGNPVIEAGVEVSYITYDEPDVMEEKGVMYGIAAGASTCYKKYILKADGRFSYGQVDYKNSGTLDDIDDYIVEIRGTVGQDFLPSPSSAFTPYIGIGYRYLNDDTAGLTTSTGARGYERESEYLYSPIGMETMVQLNKAWSAGLVLEYDHFWRGWQTSHLSDVNLGYNDLENIQKKGYGLRSSLKLLKKGTRVNLVIEPFIRYWNIKKSDEKNITYAGVIVGYGYEPKNNSTEYGVKLGVNF